MTRARTLIVCGLALLLVVPGFALAQTTSSSSSGSSSGSSSSIDIDRSDAFLAVALGAGGGRASYNRAIVVELLDDALLIPETTCFTTARLDRDGNLEPRKLRVTDSMRIDLARALTYSQGNVTDDVLAVAFDGSRDKLVIAECPNMSARMILFGNCAMRGRGCEMALTFRVLLDPNGLDGAEKALLLGVYRT